MKYCVVFLLLSSLFLIVAIVNRWDSIIDSMRTIMRPSWPWIHFYGLVKRLVSTNAMENICSVRMTERRWREKKKDGLVVFTSRATELLRIIRAGSSVSQQHIVATRRQNCFLSSFFLIFSSLRYASYSHAYIHYQQSITITTKITTTTTTTTATRIRFLLEIKSSLLYLSHVQKRIMRSNSTSAAGDPNHHYRPLFIRRLLTDFRRQSSVNDYKFPNTLVRTYVSPENRAFANRIYLERFSNRFHFFLNLSIWSLIIFFFIFVVLCFVLLRFQSLMK